MLGELEKMAKTRENLRPTWKILERPPVTFNKHSQWKSGKPQIGP